MKYLKMLGLAALAAMAVTAVMGATSASAATICTTDLNHAVTTSPCGTHGYHAKSPTTFKATTTPEAPATLTSGFTNVTCQSHVHGTITNATTGHGHITELAFTECHNSNKEACTAATTGRPWTATTAYTSGTNGKMTVNNVAGTFTCPAFGSPVTCNYSAASATATVEGSHTTATVRAEKVPLLKAAGSNFLCSNEATWTGVYHISTPTSLVVTP